MDLDITVKVKPAIALDDLYETLVEEFGAALPDESKENFLARQAENYLVSRYIGRQTMKRQHAAAQDVAGLRASISMAHEPPAVEAAAALVEESKTAMKNNASKLSKGKKG